MCIFSPMSMESWFWLLCVKCKRLFFSSEMIVGIYFSYKIILQNFHRELCESYFRYFLTKSSCKIFIVTYVRIVLSKHMSHTTWVPSQCIWCVKCHSIKIKKKNFKNSPFFFFCSIAMKFKYSLFNCQFFNVKSLVTQ